MHFERNYEELDENIIIDVNKSELEMKILLLM